MPKGTNAQIYDIAKPNRYVDVMLQVLSLSLQNKNSSNARTVHRMVYTSSCIQPHMYMHIRSKCICTQLVSWGATFPCNVHTSSSINQCLALCVSHTRLLVLHTAPTHTHTTKINQSCVMNRHNMHGLHAILILITLRSRELYSAYTPVDVSPHANIIYGMVDA